MEILSSLRAARSFESRRIVAEAYTIRHMYVAGTKRLAPRSRPPFSPSYSTITLYQLGQRFIRADSRSDATLHFVFGKHAQESNVLKALAHTV